MLKEFKEFAMRGNVVDMAIGILIGGAFAPIAGSLVADVLMPPIGLALGRVDFANFFVVLREGSAAGPYASLAAAQEAGAVTINYGVFINTVITFLIVAFVAFLVVKMVNRMRREQPAPAPAPATKDCPYCATAIPIPATRCPACTSQLG